MPKNIPSLRPKELIKLLEKSGCTFHNKIILKNLKSILKKYTLKRF
jgi:hypothetical protein